MKISFQLLLATLFCYLTFFDNGFFVFGLWASPVISLSSPPTLLASDPIDKTLIVGGSFSENGGNDVDKLCCFCVYFWLLPFRFFSRIWRIAFQRAFETGSNLTV